MNPDDVLARHQPDAVKAIREELDMQASHTNDETEAVA